HNLLLVGRGEPADRLVVVVQGQAELPQVVLAAHAVGGLAHLLDGGQQQADQDGDDGDHHQQLDQGEGVTAVHGGGPPVWGRRPPLLGAAGSAVGAWSPSPQRQARAAGIYGARYSRYQAMVRRSPSSRLNSGTHPSTRRALAALRYWWTIS